MKGMGKMVEGYYLEELKVEIEDKRKTLNELIVKDTDKDKLLSFSVELDNLIGRYYNIKLDKNRVDN